MLVSVPLHLEYYCGAVQDFFECEVQLSWHHLLVTAVWYIQKRRLPVLG